jgi:hypothetical protein
MKRRIPALVGATAVVLLAVQSTGSWAQAPSHQTMEFGGGTSFDFLIPVQATGPIWIKASIDPNVPMDAYLFSPRSDHPVAMQHGPGTISVTHQVTSWKAGDQWMVRLTVGDAAPNVRGSVRVTWPSGNRPGAVVAWHDAGPTDPVLLAQMRDRLGDLRSQLASGTRLVGETERRLDVEEMASTLETRLDVLAVTPAKYIRNDVDRSMRSTALRSAPGRLSTWSDAVSVSFVELECLQHNGWHVDHAGDQPYVVAAIVPGDDGKVTAGRTPVFRFVRGGDEPSTVPGNGELVRAPANGKAQVLLAVLERENGDVDRSMDRFAQAVDLFSMYSTMDGAPASDEELGWLLALTAVGSDEIIGTPHLLTVTPAGVYNGTGTLVAWALDDPVGRGAFQRLLFDGFGAQYAVAVKVQAERVGR